MRNLNCGVCKKDFVVHDDSWTRCKCPHCNSTLNLPNSGMDMEKAGQDAALAIVKIIGGAILIGVAFATMM